MPLTHTSYARPVSEREEFFVDGQRVLLRSSEDLSPLPAESVDLVVTSPPYWNLKDYGHPEQIGASDYDEYLERLDGVWAECHRLGRPDSVLAINIGNRRHKKRFYPIGMDIAERMEGWVLWDIVIWYVPNALPQPYRYVERLLDNKFEFLLIFTKDGSTDYTFHKPRVPQKYLTRDPRDDKRNPAGRCLGNVVRIPAYKPPQVKAQGYHAAAYPEELAALVLECYSNPGDTVLDPFLGSGTTLKVARGMDRQGIGVEINADYAPLIEDRILEPFEVPDWRNLDIIHSSTMDTKPLPSTRKAHIFKDVDRAGPTGDEGAPAGG